MVESEKKEARIKEKGETLLFKNVARDYWAGKGGICFGSLRALSKRGRNRCEGEGGGGGQFFFDFRNKGAKRSSP